MQICIVIPPSPFLIDDRVFPFLGPLQIAAVARDLGHNTNVADLSGYHQRHPKSKPTLDEVIAEASSRLQSAAAEADLVGFYSLAAQHPIVCRLLRDLKKINPNVTTVVGGPHPSTAPERCLKDGFDYVLVADQGGGGGESGFIELLHRLENRCPRGISLSLVGESDRIIKIPSRVSGEKYQNDRWPLPARDLIDLPSYRYFIEDERGTSIVSSTGCPFACVYCSHWGGYRKLEAKSPSKVQEEIRSIRKAYGWNAIMFYDDEINLRPDFTDAFLPMLRGEGIVWRAFFKNGPNLTKPDIFKVIAESGCRQLCTGAETANPAMLKAIRKGATLENNTDFVRLCVKYGIKPKVFTQVGLPGETPATVQELRNWLVQMASEGLADADVSITTPYEGTPLYDKPEDFNIHYDREELDYSEKMILYKGVPGQYKSYVWHDSLTREDIVEARQWVEDEFRSAAGLAPLQTGKDDG